MIGSDGKKEKKKGQPKRRPGGERRKWEGKKTGSQNICRGATS